MHRFLTVACVATCLVIACAGISCAPGIPRPPVTKGWEKNPGGRFEGDNAKFRKLAEEASDEENEAIERLCKHPWWDEKARNRWEKDDPWHFENMIENIQNRDVTTYYVSNGNNESLRAIISKSDIQKQWLLYTNDPKANAMSFDQLVISHLGKENFEVTFAQPKKPDPDQKMTTPSSKRARMEAVRVLLDGLDAADKKRGD